MSSRVDPWASRAADLSSAGWLGDNPADANDAGQSESAAIANLGTAEASRYELGGLIGAGAMGDVYVAWDRRLNRHVALKRLKAGVHCPALLRRFVREVQLTGGLEHPGIVPVLDAGIDPDGRPFYTMRLILGRSLAEAIRSRRTLSERMSLLPRLQQVCEAVAYAHRRGVVHRDLKPSNIMVSDLGDVLVVDWGLARRMTTAPEEEPGPGPKPTDPALSATAGVLGTPAYMGPEQRRGEPPRPGFDVWALGQTLRQLLTGRPPGAGSDDSGAVESLKAAAAAGIPPELWAIVTTALDPDLGARFPDAEALADNLRAWLDGQRVGAYSYSRGELLRRLVRAWRAPLWVALLAIVALLTTGGLAYRRTVAEGHRARIAERKATATARQMRVQQAREDADRAEIHLWRGELAEAALLSGRSLAVQENVTARGVWAATASDPWARFGQRSPISGCREYGVSGDGRWLMCVSGHTAALWRLGETAPRWRVERQNLSAAHFWAGSRRVALVYAAPGSAGTTVETYAVESGESLGRVALGPIRRLVFGTHRVLTLRSTPAVIDVETGQATRLDWEGGIHAACANGDMSQILLVGPESRIHRFDAATGRRLGRYPTHLENVVTAIAWLPERGRVLLGDSVGGVTALDLKTGEQGRTFMTEGGLTASIEGPVDGRALVNLDAGPPWLFDMASGQAISRLPAALGLRGVLDRALGLTLLGPRGATRLVLSASPTTRLRVNGGLTGVATLPGDQTWLLMGTEIGVYGGRDRLYREAGLPDVAKPGDCAPDGTACVFPQISEGVLRVYDPKSWRSGPVVFDPGGFRRAVMLRAQRLLATGPGGGLWSARATPAHIIERPQRLLLDTTFADLRSAPNGRFAVALADVTGQVTRLEAGPNGALRTVHGPAIPGARAAGVANTGAVVVAHLDRLMLFSTQFEPIQTIQLPSRTLLSAALSPDATLAAAGDRRGSLVVIRVADGAIIADTQAHLRRVPTVFFSASGALFSAGWGGVAQRWSQEALTAPRADITSKLRALEAAFGLTPAAP